MSVALIRPTVTDRRYSSSAPRRSQKRPAMAVIGIASRPAQPRLGQIEIALNPAQCIIIDDALVAQMDDRFAFGVERFLLEPLILRSRDFAATFIRIIRAKFQLLDALVVFGMQSVDRILRKFDIRG